MIILLSLGAWWLTKRLVNVESQRRAKYRTQIVAVLIEQHFNRLRGALLDLRYYFQNRTVVTTEDIRDYIVKTNLINRISGVQGFGYSVIYRNEQDVKKITERQKKNGYTDFRIWPESTEPLKSSILAIYPDDWRNRLAYGFDMMSEATRRMAILKALKTNDAVMTDAVKLVQEEKEENKQNGLLVYTPDYYNPNLPMPELTKDENFKGMIYAIIRVDNFLEELLDRPDFANESIQYKIYSEDAREDFSDVPIYVRFPDYNAENDGIVNYQLKVKVLGKEWFIRAQMLPHSLGFVEKYAPDVMLVFSLSLMFLVTLFVLQNHRRLRKEVEFAQKAEDLAIKAEAANQAKSAFLANMSHEIRTPLGAIIGFSEIIASDELTSEKKKNLISQIRKNGETLTKLLSDILDSARIEAGRMDIELEPVHIPNLMNEVLESTRFLTNDKRIDLLVLGDEQKFEHMILTDEVRLKQILVNLINNAIRFTEKGKVCVRYGRQINRGNQDVIYFEVEDSGIGISKQNQDQLFKTFEQVDSTFTRKYGGTGLGLALSKKLAQLVGGDVFLLSSDLGQGSTFRVEIPYRPTESKYVAKKEKMIEQNIDLSGCRILLVEDSVDNQEIFSMFLSQANANVKIVKDGKEALEEGIKPNFDIILMDIQIPHYDGKFVTRELRRQGVRIPIVALTAHAQKEEVKACFVAGCNGHIAKPVTKESLLFSVKNNVSA